jgi:hypothetical protein
MRNFNKLKNIFIYGITAIIFSSNSMAMENFEQNKKINFSYNINYNNIVQNSNIFNSPKVELENSSELFQKDKFGKLVSFNEEKIQNEKILDFVGMFTSRYDSRKKLRFKLRLDNDYDLQSAVISYKFQY